jgi:hypothetical protein
VTFGGWWIPDVRHRSNDAPTDGLIHLQDIAIEVRAVESGDCLFRFWAGPHLLISSSSLNPKPLDAAERIESLFPSYRIKLKVGLSFFGSTDTRICLQRRFGSKWLR